MEKMENDIFGPSRGPRQPIMLQIREHLSTMKTSNPEFEAAFENNDFFQLQEIWRRNSELLKLKTQYNINYTMNMENKSLVKSDEKSNLIRNEANKLLRSANSSEPHTYLPILYRYEAALCFAKSDECKYKAFGNISKVYEHLKMYDQCLRTGQYAMKHAASANDQFKQKITGRLSICLKEIELNQKVRMEFLLTVPPKLQIPHYLKLGSDSSGDRFHRKH